MPAYIVDFVLYGSGDICIEADDEEDARRKFASIPAESLIAATEAGVVGVSPLAEHLVPVFRRLMEKGPGS
jgi:hypothetical protein